MKCLLHICSLAFLLIALTCASTSADDTPTPFKLAAILPLTGNFALYGENVRNGMQLAVDELGDKNFQLLFEDDSSLPQKSVTAFQKLSRIDRVNAVVTVSAQSSMAIAPLADGEKVPLLAIAIPQAIVNGHPFVFLHFATAENLARVMVEECAERSIKRIIRVSTLHDGRATMKSQFDAFSRGNIVVALDDEVAPSEREFKSVIARMARVKNVDAIHLNLIPGQIGIFARQIREQGMKTPLFTSEFFSDPGEVAASGGALIGQWYAEQRSPTLRFTDAYEKRFRAKPIMGAANGYELVKLLHTASTAGFARSQPLVDYLTTIKSFDGGALSDYSVMPDHRFEIGAEIKTVIDPN